MKQVAYIVLLLFSSAALAQVDGGLNYNFNKPQDPVVQQVWKEDMAGKEKAGLNFCNIPGEHDCNLKMKGFRVCGGDMRWGKWNWVGADEKSADAFNYRINCAAKR